MKTNNLKRFVDKSNLNKKNIQEAKSRVLSDAFDQPASNFQNRSGATNLTQIWRRILANVVFPVTILLAVLSIAVFGQETATQNASINNQTAEKSFVAETKNQIGRILAEKQKPLALREAIEMALENNPDAMIARKTVQTAELDLQAARGAYDFRVGATTNFERQKLPPTSLFNSGPNGSAIIASDLTNSVRLEKDFAGYGSRFSTEFSATRSTTNNTFNDFRRSFPTALTFSFAQPILRGRSIDESRRRLEIAKRNLTLTDQQFRARTIDVIANVQRAYWNLTFALKNLQVQQDAVRDTAEQFSGTKRRVEAGEVAPIELAAVEGQIARFQIDAFAAISDVEEAQNTLKNLIAKNEQAELWSESILPIDAAELAAPQISLAEAIAEAEKSRIEPQQNRTLSDINRLNQRFLREQLKPQLDLTVNYSLQGFAGSLNQQDNGIGETIGALQERVNQLSALANLPALPASGATNFVVSPNLRGNYLQSLENLALNRFNVLSVGLTINFPIGNRTAKAEFGKSVVEADRLEIERRQTLQTIRAEVRNAWAAVQTASAALAAAETARSNAEREFASEQRKYFAGRNGATINEVLERQKQFNSARRGEVLARTDLNKAISELDRATGTTLSANAVVVTTANDSSAFK